MKRPIGFIAALVALILLSPIFIATMILLQFANKGAGVFFTQDRPGRNEKIFKAIKFKTMTDERDADGNLLPDADRLTPVGKFVRSTSIYELPQLINILKGDMSIIGPRPGDVESKDTYEEDEKDKLLIRPGITGYTQAYYRNNLGVRDKRLYDAWYAHNVSLLLDVKIFFKSIVTVLKRENVYTN